jgi:SAM-dependent methyltransferase
VRAQGWQGSDTEEVTCCLCDIPGTVLYRMPPLAVVRCPTCRLVYVSPRLSADALQRFYDEPAYFEDGGVYGGRGRFNPALALQRSWTAGRLEIIQEAVPPPASLLEIGTGYGLFLSAARDVGYKTWGVELSRTAAAHARDARGLDVYCGQLVDAPDGDLADAVCFWDTLEHVPDPLVFLTEVRRRLAPAGTFALSVPYISAVPARLLGRRWWTLKPEQHIWHFTPATLAAVAARAGLTITTVCRSPVRRANLGRLDSLVAVGRALP